MKIGILGSGDVARALGKGFVELGHEVKISSREARNPKSVDWAEEQGPKASEGSFRDAGQFGEVIVLATLGLATESAIKMAGNDSFKTKVVIDATNPLDTASGMPPKLIGGVGSSSGEKIQKQLPSAFIVKAFNTVGSPLMFKPQFPTRPDMFICGENDDAKKKVGQICNDFGWGVVDAGGISSSHYLECMCMVWVLSALKTNQWMQAFKMVKAG